MTATALSIAERAMLGGYLKLHPVDAARALEQLGATDVASIFQGIPTPLGTSVVALMQPDAAAEAIAALPRDRAAETLGGLNPSLAANLLARQKQHVRDELQERLPEEARAEIELIASYPPRTAGALMDPSVTAFVRSTTVSHAIERLRGHQDRRIADVVITDDEGQFLGVASLQALVTAPAEQTLGALMTRDAPHVRPMTMREEVVELIDKLKLASLPVVDFEGHVVGILRHDALVDATRRDATQDMQRMVGTSEEERALSKPTIAIKSRLPWLYINLLTAFLASAVVGLFESTIAQFTAVAVLLPVVAGQSGNTGAQALAVTMRGLALREVRTSQAARVLRKEALVGALNGVGVAVVTSACVYFYAGSGLALVMLLAMVAAMIIASVAGAAIPIVLTAAKRDPAVASSIILTTVTDVFGFLVFLGLATLLSPLIAQ